MKWALAAAVAGLVVIGCATVPSDDGLPPMRYAKAVSAGAVGAVTASRPSPAQIDQAEISWRRAMGEVLACRLSHEDALKTGLAGAVELATMSALAAGGDHRPNKMLLSRYAKSLVEQAFAPGPRPDAARCRQMARWSERVREDGREALGEAIARGFIPLL